MGEILNRFSDLFKILFNGGDTSIVTTAIVITVIVMIIFGIFIKKADKVAQKQGQNDSHVRQPAQPKQKERETSVNVDGVVAKTLMTNNVLDSRYARMKTKGGDSAEVVVDVARHIIENASQIHREIVNETNTTYHSGTLEAVKTGDRVRIGNGVMKFDVAMSELPSLSNARKLVHMMIDKGILDSRAITM